MRVTRFEAARRRRLLKTLAGTALMAGLLGPMMPARAATTYNGTIAVIAWSSSPQILPDWPVFLAQQCQQHRKDGVMEAFYNAIPLRGKTVTITMTGAAQGAPAEREIEIKVRYQPCTSATFVWTTLKELRWGETYSFVPSALAHSIALVNAGTTVQLAYRLTHT